MKIKNTRELVLRMQAHARADHIKQGTYGRARTNGHAEFKGCFIGCAATPHRQKDLRAHIKRVFGRLYSGPWQYHAPDSTTMTGDLSKEFGINERLSRLCEDIFEDFRYHSEAIDFLPAFAKALQSAEGKDISPRAVRRFWRIWDDGEPAPKRAEALFAWVQHPRLEIPSAA